MDKVNSFPGFINLDVTAFLWEDVVFILFCDCWLVCIFIKTKFSASSPVDLHANTVHISF